MGSCASRGLLPHPQVETKSGVVEGCRHPMPGCKGEHVNVWLGIPFATPPLGPLRFTKSKPPAPWKEVLICRRYRARPIQTRTPWDHVDVGPTDESCLFLNIVGPGRTSEKHPVILFFPSPLQCVCLKQGYPVLLYIHGGGFSMDSASKYNWRACARQSFRLPSFHLLCLRSLVRHDVIVVTVEYRRVVAGGLLGYLGFFVLDDTHAKGNYGLSDMILGLGFVKENIAAFGGDPGRITVFGQSAGAVSTGLLCISPASRDLFQQAILMGGFPESSWGVNDRSYAIAISRRKALKLGFRRMSTQAEWSDEENRQCVEFLRKLPAARFGMTMLGEFALLRELRLRMAPVVDTDMLPGSIRELTANAPVKRKMLLAFSRRDGKFAAQLIARAHEKIELWAKERGREMPLTIEAFRQLYGISEMLLHSKKEMQRVIVRCMSEFINEAPMHAHVLKSLEREGTVYRYVFDHHNRFITALFNGRLPSSPQRTGQK
ncbi:Carboxylic ester hydrolase [Aphelenchoides fujianensis]|nr:Carboxylic ester hydrolase [Aphelenchoides fujianensis]